MRKMTTNGVAVVLKGAMIAVLWPAKFGVNQWHLIHLVVMVLVVALEWSQHQWMIPLLFGADQQRMECSVNQQAAEAMEVITTTVTIGGQLGFHLQLRTILLVVPVLRVSWRTSTKEVRKRSQRRLLQATVLSTLSISCEYNRIQYKIKENRLAGHVDCMWAMGKFIQKLSSRF
jgi:hypothetical protein